MPVVATTAYGTVESLLMRARALANDMEVEGGDILTDGAPFTFQFVSQAYERIQSYLAQYGVETYAAILWLVNVPANTTGDPESRVIISDSGTQIITPNGQSESSFATPVLPDDLVAPLRIRSRPSGATSSFAWPARRTNDGLTGPFERQSYLWEWDWFEDTLWLRGATQSVDIELKYEKHLPPVSQVGDAVPIRGVTAAAAYRIVYEFARSRGQALANSFGTDGQQELDLLVNRTVRARQRKRVRRRPYRGRTGRPNYYTIP